MNWLDVVLIIGLAISVVLGIQAGLIKVAFMLVGGIIGVVLAGRYSDGLGDILSFIPGEGVAYIIAFILIVAATVIVAMIAGMIVKKVVHILPLVGWVDRWGGGIIGLLAGAIIIGALLAMWMKYGSAGGEVILDSALANFLLDKFGIVLGLLPPEYQIIHDFFEYW